ncbi:Putative flippase GtrA (transmembrane translocase of bactoprenol-linked glucose) [Sphingobium sp. AP50]|jgi:putative flippase GtrA|uniref:GtrA family protein n=1 Tax=Sphingobium sp. AP50 TaxID=1884369 RepID=UPI0008B8205E|nr:GtrA family protein [Sphingobium sp. AP50]SEI62517.1 Putative flippase GtrA (transmembrane translocase of bactoprenol-linked glucose) [Sphingobium sp. AP50]
MKYLSRLYAEHGALFWQIVRYGVTGLFVTACQAAIYWALAAPVGLHPQLANFIGYVAAVAIGYASHSAFTFRGHGTGGSHATRGVRFVAVSLISYAINALWVYLCVTHMHWPEWSPIPAMIFVTPLIVFGLNRQWVFR